MIFGVGCWCNVTSCVVCCGCGVLYVVSGLQGYAGASCVLGLLVRLGFTSGYGCAGIWGFWFCVGVSGISIRGLGL